VKSRTAGCSPDRCATPAIVSAVAPPNSDCEQSVECEQSVGWQRASSPRSPVRESERVETSRHIDARERERARCRVARWRQKQIAWQERLGQMQREQRKGRDTAGGPAGATARIAQEEAEQSGAGQAGAFAGLQFEKAVMWGGRRLGSAGQEGVCARLHFDAAVVRRSKSASAETEAEAASPRDGSARAGAVAAPAEARVARVGAEQFGVMQTGAYGEVQSEGDVAREGSSGTADAKTTAAAVARGRSARGSAVRAGAVAVIAASQSDAATESRATVRVVAAPFKADMGTESRSDGGYGSPGDDEIRALGLKWHESRSARTSGASDTSPLMPPSPRYAPSVDPSLPPSALAALLCVGPGASGRCWCPGVARQAAAQAHAVAAAKAAVLADLNLSPPTAVLSAGAVARPSPHCAPPPNLAGSALSDDIEGGIDCSPAATLQLEGHPLECSASTDDREGGTNRSPERAGTARLDGYAPAQHGLEPPRVWAARSPVRLRVRCSATSYLRAVGVPPSAQTGIPYSTPGGDNRRPRVGVRIAAGAAAGRASTLGDMTGACGSCGCAGAALSQACLRASAVCTPRSPSSSRASNASAPQLKISSGSYSGSYASPLRRHSVSSSSNSGRASANSVRRRWDVSTKPPTAAWPPPAPTASDLTPVARVRLRARLPATDCGARRMDVPAQMRRPRSARQPGAKPNLYREIGERGRSTVATANLLEEVDVSGDGLIATLETQIATLNLGTPFTPSGAPFTPSGATRSACADPAGKGEAWVRDGSAASFRPARVVKLSFDGGTADVWVEHGACTAFACSFEAPEHYSNFL
jgi:hypothetical protein